MRLDKYTLEMYLVRELSLVKSLVWSSKSCEPWIPKRSLDDSRRSGSAKNTWSLASLSTGCSNQNGHILLCNFSLTHWLDGLFYCVFYSFFLARQNGEFTFRKILKSKLSKTKNEDLQKLVLPKYEKVESSRTMFEDLNVFFSSRTGRRSCKMVRETGDIALSYLSGLKK